MKKEILTKMAKAAEKAVKEACGLKSNVYYYEPQMPAALKNKKMK